MTSRFLRASSGPLRGGAELQFRDPDEFVRSCSSRAATKRTERRHVREASTRNRYRRRCAGCCCSPTVETIAGARRAVDGFSCGACKVRRGYADGASTRRDEGVITSGWAVGAPPTSEGSSEGVKRGDGPTQPDATLDTARRYTPGSPERNKAQSR